MKRGRELFSAGALAAAIGAGIGELPKGNHDKPVFKPVESIGKEIPKPDFGDVVVSFDGENDFVQVDSGVDTGFNDVGFGGNVSVDMGDVSEKKLFNDAKKKIYEKFPKISLSSNYDKNVDMRIGDICIVDTSYNELSIRKVISEKKDPDTGVTTDFNTREVVPVQVLEDGTLLVGNEYDSESFLVNCDVESLGEVVDEYVNYNNLTEEIFPTDFANVFMALETDDPQLSDLLRLREYYAKKIEKLLTLTNTKWKYLSVTESLMTKHRDEMIDAQRELTRVEALIYEIGQR